MKIDNTLLNKLTNSLNLLDAKLNSFEKRFSNIEKRFLEDNLQKQCDGDYDYDKTHKEYSIDFIMNNFNFERVQRIMKYVDWKWYTADNKTKGIPSVNELKKFARSLLSRAWDEETTIASGGFEANCLKDGECGDKFLSIKFVLEEFNNY